MNESVVVGENTAKNITDYWYDLNGNQIAKTYAIIDSTVTVPVEPSAPVATDAPEAMPMSENNGEDIGISIRNVSDITDGEKPELSEYDALNRLVKVKIGNKVYKYGYDENGLRTWKKVNGVKTYFVWDDDQIVLEINENESVKKKYVRGLSLIYSEDDDSTTNDRVYYNYNGHGDVVQLLDSEGNVTKYYEYDSFGNEVNEDENDENPWRYCGEYYDKETKTVYLRARYYNPSYGRFTTQDPAQDGLNWYVYCDNEPVMNVDYLGLWTTKIGKGHNAIMSSLGVKTLISKANYYTDSGSWPKFYFHKINENKLISRIIETYNAAVDFRYNNKKPNNYDNDLEKAVNQGINNLNYNKDSSKNSRRSWVCLGYAFHAYQDMYAHKTMVKPLEGPSKGSWISSSSLDDKYKKGWIDKDNYLVSRFNNAKSYSKTLLNLFLILKRNLKQLKNMNLVVVLLTQCHIKMPTKLLKLNRKNNIGNSLLSECFSELNVLQSKINSFGLFK